MVQKQKQYFYMPFEYGVDYKTTPNYEDGARYVGFFRSGHDEQEWRKNTANRPLAITTFYENYFKGCQNDNMFVEFTPQGTVQHVFACVGDSLDQDDD